jgi:predicted nucleic-acid-binding protein
LNKAFIDTSALLRFLIKDDEKKRKACESLIREAPRQGITLYILPVTVLEIVWVLEKVYRYGKKEIREIVEAILNTPELKCELETVFRMALIAYESKNVKFADAVMGYWGLEKGITTVFTYDESHFKRIEGLEVRQP